MLFKKKTPKDAPVVGETDAAAASPVEGAEGDDGEAAPAKKGGKKLILIGAAAAVLLAAGGGGGAWFFLLKPKAGADAHAEKAGDHGKAKKKKKKEAGGHGGGGKDKAAAGGPLITEGPDGVVFYTLPDLVVNIQSPDGRPTYLKLKLTLELPDHETVEALEPNTPRLNDMFTTFLRELRPEDLSGSQGTYQLRLEILRRVNLVTAPAEVNAVLIEEMLIQG